ncbi:MAG: trypsin-like peptidase domain-containing protein [Armatimonadetes bacterium]|nr:trypsin-like peptidase domain-containing protein [Armatimonadota bacterium]
MTGKCGVAAVVAICLWPLLATGARAQDEMSQLDGLVTRQAPAIVSIKAVLKTEVKFGGAGQAQESRLNLTGVAVTPDGLIMISNTPFSPMRMMEMMGMPAEMNEMGMKATPTSLKVVVGKEEKEYDAFLAATDTNLDLAFIQMEGLADRKLPFVDFGLGTTALVGQKVAQVNRLSRGYDYAPYFQTARVNGEIGKPRTAWMLEGYISTFGLPVFSMTGEVVGVLTTIPSGVKEQGGADGLGFGMLMRIMGGGGGGAVGGAFVLPTSVVKALVEQAKVRAVEVAAERAKPKPKPKPAAPAKPATKPKTGK